MFEEVFLFLHLRPGNFRYTKILFKLFDELSEDASP